MECWDPGSLPTGPLSMSTLLALEPHGLRRILKAGLRQGISDGELKQLIRETFAQEDRPDEQILQLLARRGWLTSQDGRWKTKLG